MLFTVDEARSLKPVLAGVKELGGEYKTYKSIVNAFSAWFFVLTTIKALSLSTVIVSLFNQEPNLMVSWDKGYGVGCFLIYLVISSLPLIGNLADLVISIAAMIAAFTIGGGITSNFMPFVLPIIITYIATFGLILFSNSLINSIVRFSCPKIYDEIKLLSDPDDFTRYFYDIDVQLRNAEYDAADKDGHRKAATSAATYRSGYNDSSEPYHDEWEGDGGDPLL